MTMTTKKKTKGTTILLLVVTVLCSSQVRVLFFVDAINDGSDENQKGLPLKRGAHQRKPQRRLSDSAVIQVVESEIWDASSDSWKGQHEHRWTNNVGQVSPSPSEIQPPEGWEFSGDWKIVISNNQQGGAGGGGGDALGWEYQFQYLRPPVRRRIWLRRLTGAKAKPKQSMFETSSWTALSLSSRQSVMQRIRDNWNFKGYGMSLYKSFILPSSFGIGVRLPLTVNFEYFDSRPQLPSVTCGTALFFPWTIMGFFAATIHVEWVKWVTLCTLASLSRILLWALYKVVLPLILAMVTAFVFPIRHRLPSIPTTIPRGFWNVAKPRYNAEISECIGCSLSYRWSQTGGSEFRINYSHSYLPTFSVYQELLEQAQQQWNALKKTVTRRKRNTEKSLSTVSKRSGNMNTSNYNHWWQKHFARLGVGTGYPIPNPPYFSCSAILSLSGLYFGINNQPTTSTSLNLDDHGVSKTIVPFYDGGDDSNTESSSPAEGRTKRIAPEV
jgi:hypothetical protein